MPEGVGADEAMERFGREVREWIAAHRPPPPEFPVPRTFLEVTDDRAVAYYRDWQRALYEAGYLGFDVPKACGGRGVDPARGRIVEAALREAGAPFLINAIGLQWAGPTILACGTEAQKQRYLPPLLSGEELWCQGFSEPGAGSDLANIATRAERDGDGYRITGHKVWTTLARHAAWMILLARTEAGSRRHRGLSYFLFPMDAPGVTIRPLVKMTGEGGFNEVIFDGAPVPASCRLGAEGEGWKIAMTTLAFERGAAQGARAERAAHDAARLRQVVALARDARRNGRPAIDDPGVRDRLAALWIGVEAMRYGARRVEVAGLCREFPGALAAMHKLAYSEHDQAVARLAVDILGAGAALASPGGPDDHTSWPHELMASYALTIAGGTSEIQRNILAERVLGLPRAR